MLDRHDHDGALDHEGEFETETDHGEQQAEEAFSPREYQAGFWS